MTVADVRTIEALTGHRFADPGLVLEALTHTSVEPGKRGAAPFAYERLEFLGDRVLGLVMAEWLLKRFPEEREGALARRFAALVSRDALAEVARMIDLGAHLRLSSGEEDGGGRDNPATLADSCEALIGALYIDGGLEPARAFIHRRWEGAIERHSGPPQDARTALQEWAQARGLPLPDYETRGRGGPDHAPEFTVAVSVKGRGETQATGPSKREAARRAAQALLDRLARKDD